MHTTPEIAISELDLLDWKRRTFALYAAVRTAPPEAAWQTWRETRSELFATHPQSPLGDAARTAFTELSFFPYDPASRVAATLAATEPEVREIDSSTGERIRFHRFAEAAFELNGTPQTLPVFWLEGYGGGVFLPFADATSGDETYGGGRYLIDTVKGADLGGEDGRLILDFNFAYNPSCAYNPRWTCPLPPRDSRLPVAVRAGELRFT